MFDMEERILAMQESEEDDCTYCPHKNNCRNQCSEITETYNPNLMALLQRCHN